MAAERQNQGANSRGSGGFVDNNFGVGGGASGGAGNTPFDAQALATQYRHMAQLAGGDSPGGMSWGMNGGVGMGMGDGNTMGGGGGGIGGEGRKGTNDIYTNSAPGITEPAPNLTLQNESTLGPSHVELSESSSMLTSPTLEELIRQKMPENLTGKVTVPDFRRPASGGFALVHKGEWNGNPVWLFPVFYTTL
jgi:hypothetical protein